MADVIFSGRLELMTRPDKRFIVDIIDALQHRVGVLSQIPFVYDLGLQRYVLPEGYKAAKRFKDASIDIVMGRVKSEKEHMDAYASLLNAKDPETGKGLDMNELIAEAGVLIIAGMFYAVEEQNFLWRWLTFVVKAPTQRPLPSLPLSSISLAIPGYTRSSPERSGIPSPPSKIYAPVRRSSAAITYKHASTKPCA